ncbi:MAG: PBP1A family penicillin-binding protein [Chloroflexi bacterium]|nr:PBP1A family penicillin-binding protein [Chloroflexota bacterium]
MRNSTLVAVIHRRQRRRTHKLPLPLWLRILLGLLLVTLTSVAVPTTAGVVGILYLVDRLPAPMVQLVEGTISSAVSLYATQVYGDQLPDPSSIATQTQDTFKTTRLYDRTGKHLLYEIYDPNGGNRTVVHLDEVPLVLRQATIAMEDRTFYQNPGVNLRGIVRAAWTNFRYGEVQQGGSSITQQLVKNVLISPEERYTKSYERKIKEIILSMGISRRYSKDQILEWYLNTINYGRLAYGAEAAAQTYFNKPVGKLTLAESAMLAALPQAPALYDPITNPDAAVKRQHIVLDTMANAGYITQAQAEAAKKEPVLEHLAPPRRFDIVAPHFVFYVWKELEKKYGRDLVYHGGLKVITTLDVDLYHKSQEEARAHVKELQDEERKKAGNPEPFDPSVTNAAVVILEPSTGKIRSMLGSLDYFDDAIDGQVNVALASRQPGSSFKPFTYVTAFAQGYTPATMVWDVRTVFDDSPNPPYVPENYDRKYHGPQLLRSALANSYNIPAVKVMQLAGVRNVLNTAHRMGITTLPRDDYGLSLTRGEVRLIDMVFAYSVFANGGFMVGQPIPPEDRRPGYRELDPIAIERIENGQGKLIYQAKPESREVLSPQLAYLITSILSDNNARLPAFGVHNALHLDRPVAAKTGTTNDYRDAWTIGYTPQVTVGVWVGNSDNKPMKHIPGSKGAAPIWHNLMESILKPLPVAAFSAPPGLVQIEICADSGLLPTENCPKRRTEIFIQGTEPRTPDNLHQAFRICKPSGKLATIYCPPDQVETKVFTIYPPEAADWVRENNLPTPPTTYDTTYGAPVAAGPVAISDPPPYAYVHDIVPIVGSAMASDFQLFRLEFGTGLDPTNWTQIGGDHYNQVDNNPLEFWDVRGLSGLYTLQLTVVKQNQTYERSSVLVTVDNISPTVKITYPPPDAIYQMEEAEWVNVQADATDNVSMDRVEFYLDGVKFAESTVAPFNRHWTIAMSDTIPVPGPPIVETKMITNPDGSTQPVEVIVSQVTEEPGGRLVQQFANGRTIISDTGGYTETHHIYVIAFDKAGNQTKSEEVRIQVTHKPKPKENNPTALWRREDRGLF